MPTMKKKNQLIEQNAKQAAKCWVGWKITINRSKSELINAKKKNASALLLLYTADAYNEKKSIEVLIEHRSERYS